MARKDFIDRHFTIINLLNSRNMTFKEIKAQLIRYEEITSNNLDISQKTFKRDCDDILQMWGVEIKFNKSTNQYEIVYNHQDQILEKAIEFYNLIGALRKKDTIGKHLFLESRKANGNHLFGHLLQAIENNLIITFLHSSYFKKPSVRTCIPKAIKESQNRFYLVAYDLDKREFRNFGLDRITDLVITKDTKDSPRIDIEEFYKNSFGIETYGHPTNVILELNNEQKNYVKSLPFHSSQKITKEKNDTFTLELFVYPTNELILEIMKHGPNCEVIAPEFLREQVKQRIMRMYAMYK